MNEPNDPIVPQPITTTTVFVACKRGGDRLTNGQYCDGRQAQNLTPEGARFSSFKCVKCGYGWSVATGGQFNV